MFDSQKRRKNPNDRFVIITVVIFYILQVIKNHNKVLKIHLRVYMYESNKIEKSLKFRKLFFLFFNNCCLSLFIVYLFYIFIYFYLFFLNILIIIVLQVRNSRFLNLFLLYLFKSVLKTKWKATGCRE